MLAEATSYSLPSPYLFCLRHFYTDTESNGTLDAMAAQDQEMSSKSSIFKTAFPPLLEISAQSVEVKANMVLSC